MGIGKRTIKYIIILIIILVFMIITVPPTGAAAFVNISTTAIFTLPGALAAAFLVHSISNIRGKISVATLLLSDIALSAMLSSKTSFKKMPAAGICGR